MQLLFEKFFPTTNNIRVILNDRVRRLTFSVRSPVDLKFPCFPVTKFQYVSHVMRVTINS